MTVRIANHLVVFLAAYGSIALAMDLWRWWRAR